MAYIYDSYDEKSKSIGHSNASYLKDISYQTNEEEEEEGKEDEEMMKHLQTCLTLRLYLVNRSEILFFSYAIGVSK
jgi:hypothetical protein